MITRKISVAKEPDQRLPGNADRRSAGMAYDETGLERQAEGLRRRWWLEGIYSMEEA